MPYSWPKARTEEEIHNRAQSLALSVLRDLLWPLKKQPKATSAKQYIELSKIRLKAAELLVKLGSSGRAKRVGADGKDETYNDIMVELAGMEAGKWEDRLVELTEAGILPERMARQIYETFMEEGHGKPENEGTAAAAEAAE